MLDKTKVNRACARPGPGLVMIGVAIAFGVLFALGIIFFSQAGQLAQNWNALDSMTALCILLAAATFGMALFVRHSHLKIDSGTSKLLEVAHAAIRERLIHNTCNVNNSYLFCTNAQGVLSYLGAGWKELTNLPPTQLLGKSLADVLPASSRQAIESLFFTPLPSTGRTVRISIDNRGGGQRIFEVTVRPLQDVQVKEYAGVAIDISNFTQVQAKLNAQLQFSASLVENSPLPTVVCDPQGRLLRINRAWATYTGLLAGEVLGKQMRLAWPELKLPLNTDDEQQILAHGGVVQKEVRYLRADASMCDLFVSQSALPSPVAKGLGQVFVFMDVTQFREAERQTRLAKESAEASSNAKSEFVAGISHELRTPLQSILGFSELAIQRYPDNPSKPFFQDIYAAGQRMLVLVSDLLDLFKLESPTSSDIQLDRHDIRALLSEVARELHPQLFAKHLNLQWSVPLTPLVARLDPFRFQQVIRNILANAIHFSPVNARILLDTRHAANSYVEISVLDQGRGIPPQEVEAIFDPFFQSASKSRSDGTGTGLGLAISRKIIALHHGSIHAENSTDSGSLFRIQLPSADFGDTVPASP
jgi:PAS domain S-box-containing protein